MTTVSFQVEIDENWLKEMKSLMQECGILTEKDLINNALTLFRWAVNKRKSGHEIAAVNHESNRYIELDISALSAIRKSQ